MSFPFNLSYSAYSTFKESPLQFYFQYIKRATPSDVVMGVYGDAGNAVHNAVEAHIKDGSYTFDAEWAKLKVDEQRGFRGAKLDKANYKAMYVRACEYVNQLEGTITPELRFNEEWYGITVKGFIDVYSKTDGGVTLVDWKTNSTHSAKMHYDQRLFYSWALWKRDGIIPQCRWVYLKDSVSYSNTFTEEELQAFDLTIQQTLKEIDACGDNISNFEAGDWKGPFNAFRTRCGEEIDRRAQSEDAIINLEIRGNFVFLLGDVDPRLIKGIDYRTQFDLPDKYWMQQSVKKRGGMFNLEEIGRVHLYNTREHCFPIGLLPTVKKIIDDFSEYYKKDCKLTITDCRNKAIMEQRLCVQPEAYDTEYVLREYQEDAVAAFMLAKHGIINIATGGGKTMIATEIIRQVDGRTLWVIDRKELLEQTRDTLTNLLGMTIGTIGGGVVDLKEVTIATVQTLNSKLPELEEYLGTVNFVVVDEYHKSAAETYQKVFAKLPNTKYRLGLTATAYRDDGKTPILFSILGDIVYKISTQELIDLGYLIKPNIVFRNIQLPENSRQFKTYAEDYNNNIVYNEFRNLVITDICESAKDKKIIILTKLVGHGQMLEKLIPGSKHLYGSVPKKIREKMLQRFRDDEFKILIMTISIGAEGLDIPNLDMIINAAANKGSGKSIQILGRVLRLFKGKENATYIDFLDSGKHTFKHSNLRMGAFKKQGHTVTIE